MLKLILAATFALSLVFSLGHSTALAASASTQTIDVNGNANFSSILGGSINGPAALSGTVSDGQLGLLRGSANFPLRDEKITLAPTTSILFTTEQMNVGWYRFTCDQFGCMYENGISVFQRSYGSGPVDIRLGSLKGNGTLSLGTNASCVSACPPPGANWYAPTGYWQLQGAVLSSQDAGGFSIFGPAPTIH
ncbi:MAG TPA: hypothetical protein VIN63_05845 [Candidatus Limnocylindria bacterium]|jgi:hypothetical protein